MTSSKENIFVFLLVALVALGTRPASAQQYINQAELAALLGACSEDLSELPEVKYSYKVLYNSRDNNVLARNTFYKIIGDGDIKLGQTRGKLVGILNRRLVHMTQIGDTLVVPNQFDLNFCAYSPFPKYYRGGASFDKLFVIDKSIQAWAGYEHGKLARWGIVNTGAESYRTPKGRFNFNWKTEYRVSSHSPPGEPWEMYWVFNFVESRGIHIHQYPMPTGGPTSHGCVRLIEDDAKWIYNWAETWTTGGRGYQAGYATISEPGTTVLVIGDDPPGNTRPFDTSGLVPQLRKVKLPADPYDIEPGTAQQKYFDRVRGTSP